MEAAQQPSKRRTLPQELPRPLVLDLRPGFAACVGQLGDMARPCSLAARYVWYDLLVSVDGPDNDPVLVCPSLDAYAEAIARGPEEVKRALGELVKHGLVTLGTVPA